MAPIREITKEASRQAVLGMHSLDTNGDGTNKKKLVRKKSDFGPPPGTKVRPVCAKDFKEALDKVKRTGETAKNFLQNERSKTDNSSAKNMGIDMNELSKGMQILQMMMSGNAANPVPQAREEADDEVPTLN